MSAEPAALLATKPSPVTPPVSPGDWAEAEFGHTTLGDTRLQRRLWAVARDFFASPQCLAPASLWQPRQDQGSVSFVRSSGHADGAGITSALRSDPSA
ncbi:MAG: hypothetical protein KGJ60_09060 [Verrucomicrobiota bacterium]|nr:hypothetical protein [Verrucomicrobiota bacterium]